MKTIGLFAGIGGIEYGLASSGMITIQLCEIMPEARCVLRSHFPDAQIDEDVTKLMDIAPVDLLAGGFPCQNLSIAGNKQGITGEQSSLVNEIFRLIENNIHPKFVLIENVANIISLKKGEAIDLITTKMSALGYEWAYRLIDPRSFGIPQRRPRFIFLASNIMHPKDVLFPTDEDVNAHIEDKLESTLDNANAYGFYWTEGKIGIGWAKDSIPPLKCGSSLGLPSAPAIWDINRNFFGTPSVEDAELLQGFPKNWTAVLTQNGYKDNKRWKLLGNAVNTAVSLWIGNRLECGVSEVLAEERLFKTNLRPWPKAAISYKGRVMGVQASFYPKGVNYTPILQYIKHPLKPLSLKATLGFEKRVLESTLIKYPVVFKESLSTYLKNQYDYVR
ncbi:MAG: DNA (cytosine-5-)-methyltransferase [Muribaculaceae bacterium]|nr:DNA (cytosine-5-)-methyltransferase [Muribaculaceae bacterium]